MEYFKYYFLFIIMTVYTIGSHAQNDYSYYDVEYYSPQLTDIMRYDNASSADLNSGRISLPIPLLGYQDKDFNIPVSLQYNSSGYKPVSPDSYVGINWSLIVGGVIYREVNGIADDCVNIVVHAGNHITASGFLSSDRVLDGEVVFANPENYMSPQLLSGVNVFTGTDIESNSDIYHFSFGNHTGKFIINFDKTITVASKNGGHYIVDISGYDRQAPLERSNTSIIKITTDNGYVYYFGGGYGAMEYMAGSWQQNSSDWKNRNDHITAYYLSKIVAPNGREVIINYRNPIAQSYHRDPWTILSSIQYCISEQYYHNYIVNVAHSSKVTDSRGELFYTMSKIALIDNIVIDDEVINFYYSDKIENINQTLESPYAQQFVARCGVKLDSIVRKHFSTDTRLESTVLQYNYVHKRMFLKTVNNTKRGDYQFDYNSFPYEELTTKNIDHWGYLGNKMQNPQFMFPMADMERFPDPEGGTYVFDSQDIVYLDENREPSGLYYKDGLLNKVTYPTGGYTMYEYEPHYYRRYIDRKKVNAYNPGLFEVFGTDGNMQQINQKMAGGARIKSIQYYTDPGLPQKTKYYQYTEHKNNPRCSGILMHKHRYAFVDKLSVDNTGITHLISYSDVMDNIFAPVSDHVMYSSVLEYTSPDKINSEHDSVINIGISPIDNIRQKELYISIGEAGEKEKYAIWRIFGFGVGQNDDAKIVIKHLNSNTQIAYTFGPENEYTIRPLLDLPSGMYKVTLIAEPRAYIVFRAFYPAGNVDQIDWEYKRTIFSDYFLFPHLGPVSTIYGDENSISNTDDRIFNANYKRQYNIFYPDLGLVLSEEYYDRNNNLKKIISSNYDKKIYSEGIVAYTPSNISGNIGVGTRFGTFSYVNKHTFYSMFPIEKITVDIFDEKSIETKENYTYNNHGYLMENWIWDSSGGKTGVTYSYLSDVLDNDYLRQYNFLSPVTEEVRYVGDEISSVTKSIYSLHPNLNQENRVLIKNKTMSGRSFDLLESDSEVLRSDRYGNPIHIKEKDEKEMVILWGYNGQYPIAHIENASYQQVVSVLNSIPEDMSSVINPDYVELNSLRSVLPNAMVTVSEYEPFIGLKSRTDVKGMKIHYEYDDTGNLKQIYFMENGIRQILKEYRYHIRNKEL